MRKALITAALLMGLAGIAQAQETYTFTLGGSAENTKAAKQTQVGMVNLGRIQQNADVCKRGNLGPTCTQAQACVALGVLGGADCTAADALAADARIFADSLAGRQGFISQMMVRRLSSAYLAEQAARDKATLDAFCLVATNGDLEALCVAVGLTQCFVCGR